MKNSKVLKTILFISGLIAAGVGAANLFAPAAFHSAAGIDLGGDISLLSEIRASGGTLLAGGVMIMSGAFVARLAFTATVVSVLIYLSKGVSRIVGIIIDGIPAAEHVQATVLEIIIGLVCVFALLKYRDTAKERTSV